MTLDFAKGDGLVPVVVQDDTTGTVLMLGYMNQEAYEATLASGYVTFFSRSKGRLWRKGETSGNGLKVVAMAPDCDQDSLLVRALPAGPTCHTGSQSCFGETAKRSFAELDHLWSTIVARAEDGSPSSYTRKLLSSGLPRIAQKVGEEGVEVALAAVTADDAALSGEAADLLYHLLVLLKARGLSPSSVMDVLASRRR